MATKKPDMPMMPKKKMGAKKKPMPMLPGYGAKKK